MTSPMKVTLLERMMLAHNRLAGWVRVSRHRWKRIFWDGEEKLTWP